MSEGLDHRELGRSGRHAFPGNVRFGSVAASECITGRVSAFGRLAVVRQGAFESRVTERLLSSKADIQTS